MHIADYDQLEQRAADYRNNGHIDEAIELYDQLAAQMTLHGDTTKAAGMVHMIGVTHKAANRKQQSLEKLEQAKQMYEEAGDAVGAARALRDIAITHSYSGDYDAAELILLQSIAQLKSTGDSDELALSEVKLGENFMKKGVLVAANEWINRGWSKLEHSKHWFYRMTALLHRAELAFAGGDYDTCETLCQEAITIIKELHKEEAQKRRLAQLYGLIAISRMARQKEAREHHEMADFYLNQLDSESRAYLVTKTQLKDLPALDA